MAEKPEEPIDIDKKINEAKELYASGSRNYYIKAYSEASDDLSQACSIYAEIYGPSADELGMPYLLYAKSLISSVQDENKLMDLPEEQDGEDGGEDDDDDDDEEEEKVAKDDEEEEENDVPETNGDVKERKVNDEKMETNVSDTNGHSKETAEINSKSTAAEPQAHSSKTNGEEVKEKDEDEEEELDEDSPAASLQIAWEVLELAVNIFERQGAGSTLHLAESYSELANISFENSIPDTAIKDYKKSLDIYTDLPEPDRRILAEIKYKIGLCYIMADDYDESIKSMKEACSFFDDEIQKIVTSEDKTDDVKAIIKDLEETKQDILNKIIEVEESKQQSIDEVKRELAKIIGSGGGSDAGASSSNAGSAGGGTSSEENKPKPLDISHLIKRKKPESSEVEASNDEPPTKKPSI